MHIYGNAFPGHLITIYIYIFIGMWCALENLQFRIAKQKRLTHTHAHQLVGICNVKDIVRSYNLHRYIIYYVRRACNILHG